MNLLTRTRAELAHKKRRAAAVAAERARYGSDNYIHGKREGDADAVARLTKIVTLRDGDVVLGSKPEQPRMRVAIMPERPAVEFSRFVEDVDRLRQSVQFVTFEAEQISYRIGDCDVVWFNWRRVS